MKMKDLLSPSFRDSTAWTWRAGMLVVRRLCRTPAAPEARSAPTSSFNTAVPTTPATWRPTWAAATPTSTTTTPSVSWTAASASCRRQNANAVSSLHCVSVENRHTWWIKLQYYVHLRFGFWFVFILMGGLIGLKRSAFSYPQRQPNKRLTPAFITTTKKHFLNAGTFPLMSSPLRRDPSA